MPSICSSVTDGNSHLTSTLPALITAKLIRPPESVILPSDLKIKILKDAVDFVDIETAKWYISHGIPYKRCYLFYGPPGSGKSSMVTVLAGKLRRNLSFLQPSDPNMTDEGFAKCLLQAPKNSIIVIEDIDALFSKDRQTMHKTTPLTFSGLLNGLDGVANPDGQIFILTTNYIDRLDPALIRAGRVDVKCEFPSVTDEQIEGMFLHFYPKMIQESKEFVKAIQNRFMGPSSKYDPELSMAALQQHFIGCRRETPENAILLVKQLVIEKSIVLEDTSKSVDGDGNKSEVKKSDGDGDKSEVKKSDEGSSSTTDIKEVSKT